MIDQTLRGRQFMVKIIIIINMPDMRMTKNRYDELMTIVCLDILITCTNK